MALTAHFTYKCDGPKVSFNSNTSLDILSSSTHAWAFGDGSTSTDKNPEHTYSASGFFSVKLTITEGSEVSEFSRTIGVAATGQPLAKPLYKVIDQYLPAGMVIDPEEKEIRIQKWQLYLSPLVNHVIELDDIYNEFAYTALENTLIAQLIAYDQIVENTSKSAIKTTSTDGQEVKKMVQGPMETEWFQASESNSKVLETGGPLGALAKNICTLASRLQIYIPGICDEPGTPVIPFIVSKIDTNVK